MDCKLKKQIIVTLITLFFSSSLFSQIFKGIVKNNEEKPIDNCYILVLDAISNKILAYTIPSTNGEYSVVINDLKLTKVKIRCQGLPYVTETKSLIINTKINTYYADFNLKIKENKLDEVIIISKRLAIKIKNDTVVYNVAKFKRLEDQKIINVLKNMPGIQVNEKTGLILYKGKPIETILLDGDDLFDKNYSIGAKNIPSDLVDKVEAIEDYHNNKLKKGFKHSNKVVLNLKLKKGTSKISGEISLSGGKDKHLIDANTINLSSNMKGFGVFNFNNISINETPYNKETYEQENSNEIKNSSIDFFNQSSIKQTTIFPRSYTNNIKFGAFYNLFKITNKLNIKNKLSFFNDKRSYSSISKNIIYINNDTIKTSNKYSNSYIPTFISMTNDLNVDISNNSILKYSNRIMINKYYFNQTNFQNEVSKYKNKLNEVKSVTSQY